MIWIGTIHEGLWVFDGYEFRNIIPQSFGLINSDLNYIISLYETPDKNIWIGTKYDGVSIIEPFENKSQKLTLKNNVTVEKALTRVHCFYLDEDSIMWMTTFEGLVKYDLRYDSWRLFRNDLPPHQHNNFSPSIFRFITPDPNNSALLWICGMNGLFSFNKKVETFKQHRHPLEMHVDYGNMNFLPIHRQYLMSDIEIVDNLIYLASWGGGIMVYDPQNNLWRRHTFEPYTERNSLDENIVNAVLFFNKRLFFSTLSHAAFMNTDDHSIHFIDELPENEKEEFYAITEVNNNSLLWSTLGNGIHQMKIPDVMPDDEDSTIIAVTKVSIDDKDIFEIFKGIKPDSVTISPESKSVNIEFTLLNPQDTSRVEYQYKVSEYSHGWISNGSSRVVCISDLPENSYKLVARAREHDKNWIYSKEIVLLRKIYFYQSKWFPVLIIAVLMAAVYIMYRIRVLTIRKKSEIQRKLTELKLQALQAQMNPHFTFNSLNSINNFILSNNTEKASDFLTKFSRLIRQVLNNSNQTMVIMRDELEALNLYLELEQLRFENRFMYKIVIDPGIETDSIKVPPLLLQPYVENAIWHGLMHKDGSGNIDIIIEMKNDTLLFRIIDDGIGREKATQYKSKYDTKKKSLGMGITKDRIGLLNTLYQNKATTRITDLYDEHNNATGTMVEISIPVITNQQ